MTYLKRMILPALQHALQRGKSVLLLGPRQTGKTTFIHQQIKPDIYISFIKPSERLLYEKNPSLLIQEIEAEIKIKKLSNPIIVIDEVQKVPLAMDAIQDLIDRKIGRFILTGSSAKKLRHGAHVNLLPGRCVLMHLDPLMLTEIQDSTYTLDSLLVYGSLPGIFTNADNADKETDLKSYVTTYLEEEIRAEALVRNVANFSKFLFLAAAESGNIINFSKLSQAIGISHTTVIAYYQLLEDCLIAERINPLTTSSARTRLSKAPKYLFFDLGIRRACAEESNHPSTREAGHLFEQFVGLELIRQSRLQSEHTHVHYWRDHAGPEVDYVLKRNDQLIPIEVKWTERPTEKDCRHLLTFLNEYPNASEGFIVCQTPKPYLLKPNIMVISWRDIHLILDQHK